MDNRVVVPFRSGSCSFGLRAILSGWGFAIAQIAARRVVLRSPHFAIWPRTAFKQNLVLQTLTQAEATAPHAEVVPFLYPMMRWKS